jgi:hypothetical protein
MFDVRIDGLEPLLAKLDAYSGELAELRKTVPQELVAWQREDMQRKYPNITVDEQDNGVTASTTIWPTSRTALQRGRRRRYQAKGLQPHRYGIPQRGLHGPRSNRPILREALRKQLTERMNKLLEDTLQWPST